MTDIFLRKVPGGFRAADAQAEATLQGIKAGDVVKAKISRPRSLSQHRLYFGLLSKVQENTERWPTVEALHIAVKIGLGRCDLIEMTDGRIVPHPHSISFDAMGRDDFKKFFDDAVTLVIDRIIPGLDRSDLLAEVYEMVGAP